MEVDEEKGKKVMPQISLVSDNYAICQWQINGDKLGHLRTHTVFRISDLNSLYVQTRQSTCKKSISMVQYGVY